MKQIVGGTLDARGARENFVSERPASYYAEMYKRDGLVGGHVIQLGPGNEVAAREALAAYPDALQIGGGVTDKNARTWLEAGAKQVIVTSFLFDDGELSMERLADLAKVVTRDELVIDLSCRKVDDGYFVAANRWQTTTKTKVDGSLLKALATYCSEFLVHAADVEGLCRGIERDVVSLLADSSPLPVTYAGGAKDLSDLALVDQLSGGRVDLTFGSALDIFGGNGVRYEDLVAHNREKRETMG